MYQFTLDKTSKKFICPSCGQLRFVRMMDTHSHEYLAPEYGRCDRQQSCGYFLYPKSNPMLSYRNHVEVRTDTKPISTINNKVYFDSINLMESNNLFQFLTNRFGKRDAQAICTKYGVGSNPYNPDQTAFWQIDDQGHLRTAEIISYMRTGKRNRAHHPNWMHSILLKKGLISDFNLKQVCYGAHLIGAHRGKTAVVEGAKTAVLCALQYPEYLWIGTQGVHGLNKTLLSLIDPRKTILVPDSGFEDIWRQKSAHQFQIMSVSEFVAEGEDIGDLM